MMGMKTNQNMNNRRTCMFLIAVCTGATTDAPGGASIAGDTDIGREYDDELPAPPSICVGGGEVYKKLGHMRTKQR